jgi:hypothetical protein
VKVTIGKASIGKVTIGKVTIGCVVALVLCSGARVFAQDENYGRSGLYLGASLYHTSERLDDRLDEEFEDVFPGSDLDVESVEALGAVLGLRMGSRFSLELIGEQYQDMDIDLDLGLTPTAELQLRAAMLQGKLYLLTGRIQPYLMAGAGYLDAKLKFAGLSERAAAPLGRGGIGIDVYLTRNLVLQLQGAYSRGIGSELRDIEYFTFGGSAILRF